MRVMESTRLWNGSTALGVLTCLLLFVFTGCGVPLRSDPGLQFSAIPTKTLLSPDFAVQARSASSGSVEYAVQSGPASLSGNVVHLTGVGEVSISATQAPIQGYASTSSTISFQVTLAPSQLALSVGNHSRTDGNFPVQATSSSPAPVSYSVVSGPAHINGNLLSLDGVGTIIVQASQPATKIYAASSVSTQFSVVAGAPGLIIHASWSGPSTQTLTAQSSSPAPISYVVVSGPATISGNAVTVRGSGTILIRGDQASTVEYKAESATTTIVVSPAALLLSPQAISFPDTRTGATSLEYAVQVQNSGDLPAILQKLVVPPGFLLSNTCGGTVAPRSACRLGITFAPSIAGPIVTQFTASTADTNYLVSLKGNATDPRIPTLASASVTSIPAGEKTAVRLTGSNLDLITSIKAGSELLPVTRVNATDISVVLTPASWFSGPLLLIGTSATQQTNALTLSVTSPPVSYDAAVRFAQQATMAVTPEQITQIQTRGFSSWIDWQMTTDMYPYESRIDMVYGTYMANTQVPQYALRQRVTAALKSVYTFGASDYCFISQCGHYWEARLQKDAFGNFRDLMTDITKSPLMGGFLGNMRNYSIFPWTGSNRPNQNFGRELMQLMTIGPLKLNHDGSTFYGANDLTVDNYSEDNVADMASALSGFIRTDIDWIYKVTDGDPLRPMEMRDDMHMPLAKSPLPGLNLPAWQGGVADSQAALDALFQHKNVAPFVCRRLIQHLVTSNPSPAYIARVADVFDDDGKGVRGNLGAVIKAILLDSEARRGDDPNASFEADSHMMDPLLYISNTMAAVGGVFTDDRVYTVMGPMGQDLFMSPSVFGPYSPDNRIPSGDFAPEAQLVSDASYLERIAFVSAMVGNGLGGMMSHLQGSPLYGAPTTDALLDRIKHFLFHGKIPKALDDSLKAYVSAHPGKTPNQMLPDLCVIALTSSSYQVLR